MGEQAKDPGQDRISNKDGEPVAHARLENVRSFWRAVAGGGFLAGVVALFIALGVANRDYTKSVGDNLQRVVEQWNRNYEKLAERVYDLEKWRWGRKK